MAKPFHQRKGENRRQNTFKVSKKTPDKEQHDQLLAELEFFIKDLSLAWQRDDDIA